MCKVEGCKAVSILGKRAGSCSMSGEIDTAIFAAAYEVGQKTGSEIQKGAAIMLSTSVGAGCLYAKELSDEILIRSNEAQENSEIRRQVNSGNN